MFTVQNEPLLVQVLSGADSTGVIFRAGPAQFGYDLRTRPSVKGQVVVGDPFKMCSGTIENKADVKGKIVLIERGSCMFVDKVGENDRKLDGYRIVQELSFNINFYVTSLRKGMHKAAL